MKNEPYILPTEEQQGELVARLLARRLTPDTPVEPIKYSVRIKNEKTFPFGEINAIKGHAKACKSTFIRILTASLIGNSREFGIEPIEDITAVHYLDTEQSNANVYDWLTRCVAMGADPTKLVVLPMRAEDTATRLLMAYSYIRSLNSGYHVVVLDGIRDVLENINDIEEVNRVKDLLLQVLNERSNVAFITVLHTNPKDEKMRGHVGTEILNKCASEWMLTTEGEGEDMTYKAKNTASRNALVQLPVVFKWENGRVVPSVPSLPMDETTMAVRRWAVVAPLLTPRAYSMGELVSILRSVSPEMSERAAKLTIPQWVDRRYLRAEKLSKTRFAYHYEPNAPVLPMEGDED